LCHLVQTLTARWVSHAAGSDNVQVQPSQSFSQHTGAAHLDTTLDLASRAYRAAPLASTAAGSLEQVVSHSMHAGTEVCPSTPSCMDWRPGVRALPGLEADSLLANNVVCASGVGSHEVARSNNGSTA
jgi:hypothetical protein